MAVIMSIDENHPQFNFWNPNECTVEPCKLAWLIGDIPRNGFAIVDHGIQITVATSFYEDECIQWLNEQTEKYNRLRQKLESKCPKCGHNQLFDFLRLYYCPGCERY